MSGTFAYINAINMIPASGEFTYDTAVWNGKLAGASAYVPINSYYNNSAGSLTFSGATDVNVAIAQLQATLPNCTTVALVVQWMGNSLDVSQCKLYPGSTYYYPGHTTGSFQPVGSVSGYNYWVVSNNTLANTVQVISRDSNGNSAYGGTPSDQSVIRCLQAIKAAGLKAVLYLQMNMDTGFANGFPWRGLVTYSTAVGSPYNDLTTQASAAVNAFLGSCTPSNFTRDATNLTVQYSGAFNDYTYRRFVLHYANIAVMAGGVSLFSIGSELRGLEGIRGHGWTAAGGVDSNGYATWDYPFVAGLVQLAADCRSVFDTAGYTKNLATRSNLITYSPDWSQWMGVQHTSYTTTPGTSYIGIWPHLDILFASPNIDFVSFDNYLPISEWTTGTGGLDASLWASTNVINGPTLTAQDYGNVTTTATVFVDYSNASTVQSYNYDYAVDYASAWPSASPTTIGLGLTGPPDIHNINYLKYNMENGEKADWNYYNYASSNIYDPNGALVIVTAPQGDRLTQSRETYGVGQELLAFKKVRWWWSSPHRAIYSTAGWAPSGPTTQWVPFSKSIGHMEYGFPSTDKNTNEENLFYDPQSVAGGTPFWCEFQTNGALPKTDIPLQFTALQAWMQHWTTDGYNETSIGGVQMMATDLMFAWTWDARPTPVFPALASVWADSANWPYGFWINGKLPYLTPPIPSPPPSALSYNTLPALPGLSWSVIVKPKFSTEVHDRTSGKSGRRPKMVYPIFEIELTYDMLRSDVAHSELQQLVAFYEQQQGQATPFFTTLPGISTLANQNIGTGNGTQTAFQIPFILGGYSKTIDGITNVTNVSVGGVTTASYTISSGYQPVITFGTAPAASAAITISATALWLCRFAEDMLEFENFMYQLWEMKSMKLVTVKV
jgi:uncharacterized protein (TIGR02217 family)